MAPPLDGRPSPNAAEAVRLCPAAARGDPSRSFSCSGLNSGMGPCMAGSQQVLTGPKWSSAMGRRCLHGAKRLPDCRIARAGSAAMIHAALG
jgi:hypothetical protein